MKLLDQIQGQEEAIAEFRHRLDQGTLKGSFLFTGPDGVGKKTTALALAATLLGTENVESHPDLFFLEPDEKDTIKIEAARALIRRLSLKPSQAEHSLAIIDRCDRFTTEASNALLKTIEEPTGTIFLITSRPGSLLPTIRSRCQSFRFRPLSTDLIVHFLRDLEEWPEDQYQAAATLADGSLTQAQSFGSLLQELGINLAELFEDLRTKPYTQLEGRLKELPADPQEIVCLLAGLRQICRNRLVASVEEDVAPWFASIDAINRAETALRQHISPLLLWESLAFSFQAGSLKKDFY